MLVVDKYLSVFGVAIVYKEQTERTFDFFLKFSYISLVNLVISFQYKGERAGRGGRHNLRSDSVLYN